MKRGREPAGRAGTRRSTGTRACPPGTTFHAGAPSSDLHNNNRGPWAPMRSQSPGQTVGATPRQAAPRHAAQRSAPARHAPDAFPCSESTQERRTGRTPNAPALRCAVPRLSPRPSPFRRHAQPRPAELRTLTRDAPSCAQRPKHVGPLSSGAEPELARKCLLRHSDLNDLTDLSE